MKHATFWAYFNEINVAHIAPPTSRTTLGPGYSFANIPRYHFVPIIRITCITEKLSGQTTLMARKAILSGWNTQRAGMVWKAQMAGMTTELKRELVAAAHCLSILVYYVVNSSLVFKQSSGCFLGARKAQLTSLCLLHVQVNSECKEKDMSVLSLCQPEVPYTCDTVLGNTRGLWRFRDFGSISNPYLFVCSWAELLMSSSSDTGHSLAIRQVISALSVSPPMKQDIKHPTNGRNKILTDLQVSRLVGTCPTVTHIAPAHQETLFCYL